MKVSDYIVEFLINERITDVFGYPGGMVIHLMDSLYKYANKINTHIAFNEQGAALAACGYAQTAFVPGVAFATSGPGATNLITGIANAYFDSIPVIFITGQVNTYEQKGNLEVRQNGFQETDIISMVKPITKYAVKINSVEEIRFCLEQAIFKATTGRPGPVVIDIPMNIQRADIEHSMLKSFNVESVAVNDIHKALQIIMNHLLASKRPCILAGAGVAASGMSEVFVKFAKALNIPVVTSMLAVDVLPDSDINYGFIGAYGCRTANFILSKCDFLLSLGSRMDIRQTGANHQQFAPNANIVRVDIDEKEMSRKVHEDEVQILADIKLLLPKLAENASRFNCDDWLNVCNTLRETLDALDKQPIEKLFKNLSLVIENDSTITTDVGQNQVWTAQAFQCKGQRILFSGGHGAMGYSLPAAIGAYCANKKPTYSVNGDGGFQMNIQELQMIASEKLPIKIIVINNYSLGMIRHFQEMYLDGVYAYTKNISGYGAPNFVEVAMAYGINAVKFTGIPSAECLKDAFSNAGPVLVEIQIDEDTYVFPKLAMGKPNHDQEPPIERDLFDKLSIL